MIKTITLLLFIITNHFLFSQQSINSGGGDASSTMGSVSYSIGQLDFRTNSNNGTSINQGVQQPYEFFVVSVQEFNSSSEFSVFPNPTRGEVLVQCSETKNNVLAKVHDATGKLVMTQQIYSPSTALHLDHLSNGSYFIYLMSSDETLSQVLKLIKTN